MAKTRTEFSKQLKPGEFNYKPDKRRCLRCDSVFKSEGIHNRICPRCKKIVTDGDSFLLFGNNKGLVKPSPAAE